MKLQFALRFKKCYESKSRTEETTNFERTKVGVSPCKPIFYNLKIL